MSDLVLMMGMNGVIGSIGLVVFVFSYKYSIEMFSWIEQQTYGTRNYIMEKLELLFIKIKEDHITYILLALAFVPSSIFLIICFIFSKYLLGIVLASIFFIIGWKIPRPVVDHLYSKRIKAYQGQMVDGLTLLSNGIRAGMSIVQSIGMVVNEMPNPISQEFNIILQENKLGLTLEVCFENLAKRIPLQDNDMFVTSVNILNDTGGNLPETFDTIVEVIRERVRVQQKIDTYVAQGLVQGLVIYCMPYVLGFIFAADDPQKMINAASHPLGIALFVAAIILTNVGGFVIWKIVQIKI